MSASQVSLATIKNLNLLQWENSFSPCSRFKFFKLGKFPTTYLIAESLKGLIAKHIIDLPYVTYVLMSNNFNLRPFSFNTDLPVSVISPRASSEAQRSMFNCVQ